MTTVLCPQAFIIKQGKLAVTIHNTTSVLETDAVFFVPQGEYTTHIHTVGQPLQLPSHESDQTIEEVHPISSYFEKKATIEPPRLDTLVPSMLD